MRRNPGFSWWAVCGAVGQLWAATAAVAAPPANNNFAGRTVLGNTLPVSVTGSNIEATVQTGEPLPDAAEKSVWWSWTAPVSGPIEITTSGSLDESGAFPLDTVLAVYTGSTLTGLTLVEENDESSEGGTSLVRFAAVSGTAYAVQVTGWQGAQGSIKLAVKAGPPPPANDAFANAVTLSTGVSAAGTTDGATLQAAEPVPEGISTPDYQGSAWWAWTAPASGWYRLTVTGAPYDTSLSVWSGSSLAALIAVHSNRGGYPNGGTPEGEVFFQAVGGTPYPISLGNLYGSPGGAVSLIIKAAVPPVQNASLTLSAASANLTDAPATVNAVFRLVSAEPVASGSVTVISTHGHYNKIHDFDAAQRTSGTAVDGTYTVPLTFTRYLAPGIYRINRIGVSLPANVEAGIGELEPAPFAAGAARSLVIFNSGTVDTQVPALTSVGAAPAAVNISAGAQTITVTLQITDALSGFSGGALELKKEGGDFSQIYQDFGSAKRIEGTAQSGTYRILLDIPEFLEAGKYELIVSNLEDEAGNYNPVRSNSTDQGFPGPFAGTISVNKTAIHRLNSFTIAPATANVTNAEVLVTATFSVATDKGEFSYAYLDFSHPTAQGNFNVSIDSGDRTAGTATSGTYAATFPVPQYLVSGLYEPALVIRNLASEFTRFASDGDAFPAGATPGIMVTNTGGTDTLPPTLSFISASPGSFTPGGTVPLKVAVQAMDALSGVDRVQVYLQGTGATTGNYSLDYAVLDSGTSFDGIWKISSLIPGFLPPGTYVIGFSASDALNLNGTLVTNPSLPGQSITLTAGSSSSFATWATANSLTGPDAAATANPDGDPDSNLMEFGMGTDPRSPLNPEAGPGVAGKPAATTTGTGGSRRLILQFWIPEDILGANSLKLTYTAQFSSDGVNWTDVPQTSFVIDPGTSLTTSTGLRRFCTATDPVAYSVDDPRIGRIRVTQIP